MRKNSLWVEGMKKLAFASGLVAAAQILGVAGARGDAVARTEMTEISRTMGVEGLTQAREMMHGCEASNYRKCEY
jgi:hypothetical protein